MIEIHSIIEAIYRLLTKVGQSDKLKIVKLIYLADKYHLRKYGRTITNDDYYSMEYGPVGTTVKDLLQVGDPLSSPQENKFQSKLVEKTGKYEWRAKNVGYKPGWLSKTDLEVLDFVAAKFGSMTSQQLISYTHKYPEWKSNEQLFKNKALRRKRIENKELLSTIKDDLLAMPDEHVEASAAILSGKSP